jgi:Transcriptional regulators
MDNILLKIRESYSDFGLLDKTIATYVLENHHQIIHSSIKDMAEHCNTSQAAIVRFCKLLNLSGFKELKHRLTVELLNAKNEQAENVIFTDINKNEGIQNITRTIIANHTRAMLETEKLIDYETLDRAVHLIAAAPRVDFYGVGASGLVALDAQQKFIRIGKNCNAHSDPHIQTTMAANLSPDDVAVAISYSGVTKDILDVAAAARQSGAKVIAITRYGPGNPLATMADITLYTVSPEGFYRSASTSSRIAQLTMIDILFIGMASLNPELYNPMLERTYNAAKKKKSNVNSPFASNKA